MTVDKLLLAEIEALPKFWQLRNAPAFEQERIAIALGFPWISDRLLEGNSSAFDGQREHVFSATVLSTAWIRRHLGDFFRVEPIMRASLVSELQYQVNAQVLSQPLKVIACATYLENIRTAATEIRKLGAGEKSLFFQTVIEAVLLGRMGLSGLFSALSSACTEKERVELALYSEKIVCDGGRPADVRVLALDGWRSLGVKMQEAALDCVLRLVRDRACDAAFSDSIRRMMYMLAPERVSALQKEGVFAPEPLPLIGTLFEIPEFERGCPLGNELSPHRAQIVASLVSAENLANFIEDESNPIANRLSALVLAPYVAKRDVTVRDGLLEVVSLSMLSSESFEWVYYSTTFTTKLVFGMVAVRSYLQLVEQLNESQRVRYFLIALDAVLARSRLEYEAHDGVSLIASAASYIKKTSDTELFWNQMLREVEEKTRVAEGRIAVIKTLDFRTNHGADHSFFSQLRTALVDSLCRLLTDSTTDNTLRLWIDTNLDKIDRFARTRMQDAGQLRVADLPSLQDIYEAQRQYEGMKLVLNRNVLETLGREVTPEQVLSALSGKASKKSEFTACLLAPLMASRSERVPFLEALSLLLDSSSEETVRKDGCEPVRLTLSQLANEAMRHIVRTMAARDCEPLKGVLTKAIDKALDDPLASSTHIASVQDWQIICNSYAYGAPQALANLVSDVFFACMVNSGRKITARCIAYYHLAQQNAYKERVCAWAIKTLSDKKADGPLRAFIGNSLVRFDAAHRDSWLGKWVATDGPLWLLKPRARKDIPLSEPADKVPVPWLLSTLMLADDDSSVRSALLGLLGRYKFDERRAIHEASLSLKKLVGRDLEPLTRSILRFLDTQFSSVVAYHAVILLLLLYNEEHRAALVTAMANHGTFSRYVPWESADWRPNARLPVYECYLSFEAYLQALFSKEEVWRMLADVYDALAIKFAGKARPEVIENYKNEANLLRKLQ